FCVPDGTTATAYAEHGSSISDALGNAIETGGDTSQFYSKTYRSGDMMPDYTVFPPDGLNIMGTPLTVRVPKRLSKLLAENMGPVDLAFCLSDKTKPTKKVYDISGVHYESMAITIYEEHDFDAG